MADGGAGLAVRDVTVRAVVVPLRRPLATRVGDFSRWPLLLIDVTTEQGITGRGYLAPYLNRATAGLRTVLDDLGAALRGQPVSPAAAYAAARGWLGLAGYQGLALAAVAGLDIALWDALAQAAGLPLAVLLGGTLGPVPAYNSNGLGLIPPENVAEEALELLDEGGFTALKVRRAAPARSPRQRPGMGRGRRGALPGGPVTGPCSASWPSPARPEPASPGTGPQSSTVRMILRSRAAS
jgi:mandelate racemase